MFTNCQLILDDTEMSFGLKFIKIKKGNMSSFCKQIGMLFFVFFNFLLVHAQTDFNKLDEKGKKYGVWKGFYEESKRPRYEGGFNHGKEVGMFKFFDDTKTGTLIATREFNDKDNSAYTIFYDQNKFKVSEVKEVNKLYEGQWKYYHKDSKLIMTTENYKNGKLEGLRTVYYPNGNVAEETYYKNNLKDGLCKIYTVKGVVLEESTYKNNEYNGLAVFKDVNDSVASKGNFVNGKKDGIWQFYEKGKPVKEVNMSIASNVTKMQKTKK